MAIKYGSEIDKQLMPTEEVYQQQTDWDKFAHVCHERNGLLKISGNEEIEGK
jgi:hypothetical protein